MTAPLHVSSAYFLYKQRDRDGEDGEKGFTNKTNNRRVESKVTAESRIQT